MLRTAAEAAVDAAMEQSGAQLGGMPPAAFITGLAGDLGAHSPAARKALAVRWETCTLMSFLLHQRQMIRSSRQTPCVACADVPEEKAANIALGTVASKARTALIDACAAYREQDSQVTSPSLIPV